ncbi:MAG: hypothetical protein A2156_11905 [Deltaproteobacteria bacterium RBG_16_48_10]|nr:MAG: hypothetical protein A2156_11905 [Deltaproteobacteria bacterium RBG_16_48_10]
MFDYYSRPLTLVNLFLRCFGDGTFCKITCCQKVEFVSVTKSLTPCFTLIEWEGLSLLSPFSTGEGERGGEPEGWSIPCKGNFRKGMGDD